MSNTAEPQLMSPPSVTVTQAAAQRIWTIMEEEQNQALNLRVYIEGGGCSGFQYGFKFDETINPQDQVVKTVMEDKSDQTVTLLIDPLSFQYLVGATIDYQNDINGEQFIIYNPNAKTTCGCGSSFTL
ncbi:MAG: iron-sulfur cluster insertion protein ErpA [Gammaproteobacteria bacterium]